MPDEFLIRVHGDAGMPTLIYLPGLHGDWTLVSSFRAAVAGRVRFVEFCYPRDPAAKLADYARLVLAALAAHDIREGWLLAESFGSQVAWAMLDQADRTERTDHQFAVQGLVLAGGFVKHPWPWGARSMRWQSAHTPRWALGWALRGYAAYAKLRHRRAPETLANIAEFVARRTPLDSEAIRARLTLIEDNDPRPIARATTRPVYFLGGAVDPLVPWPLVRRWLAANCPGYRDSVIFWNADHNVLATQPGRAARVLSDWLRLNRPAAQ